MTVRNPSDAGANCPKPMRNGTVDKSDKAEAQDGRARELDQARAALRDTSSLSEERRAEIEQRIENGYYSEPEAVKQIAKQLANDLSN